MPKRDSGQGSICKRKDGRWVAKIQIGRNDNGKPKIKNIYAKSEAEAKRKLKEFTKTLIKNDYVQVKQTTTKDYLENWLYTVKNNTVANSSLDKMESILKNQIYPEIGNIQISNLTADDIQKLVNKMSSDGYSYSTINQAFHIINDCFKNGFLKKTVAFNPATGVVIKRNKSTTDKDTIKFYTQEEVKKISDEAISKTLINSNRHRLGWSVVLLLNTGMRIGELLGLTWEKVDFVNKEMSIVQSVKKEKVRDKDGKFIKGEYQTVVGKTKTSSSIRKIPLNKIAIISLNELKKITGNYKFVISNSNGDVLTASGYRRMLDSVYINANVEKKGIHALRHTFASSLFRNCVDVKTVSELLGHSDVSVTYNTYIHLIDAQKRSAIEAIDIY